MKEAGCYRVAFGIESGSAKILENIKKRTTLDKIQRAVRLAQKAKLITVGFFMVGNLGETDETINETIGFIRRLKLDYTQFTIATPYPGTALAAQVSQQGRIFAKDWSDYNTYTGSVFEWNDLPKAKIDAYQARMYKASYLNAGYIFRRLVTLRPNDLQFVWNGLKILRSVIGLGEPNR